MRRLIFAGLAAGMLGGGAQAQTYPSRPITIVVPFAAGGPTDAIARAISERMRVSLGQSLLIENVTGAGWSSEVAGTYPFHPDLVRVLDKRLSTIPNFQRRNLSQNI